MVMEGYIGHVRLERAYGVLRFIYSDGGLYRAFRAFIFMYSDEGLYRVYGVLRSRMVMEGYIGHIEC